MKKIIKINQLTALLIANAKELLREPAVLFWGIVFPILMAFGLGIAFTQKSDIVRSIAVIDEGSKKISEKIESFLRTKTEIEETGEDFRYKLTTSNKQLGNTIYYFYKKTWKDALVLLKRGEVNLVLDSKNGGIEYHFDPVNTDAQLAYLSLSRLIDNEKPLEDVNRNDIEPLTLQGTRYIDFLVPGLLSMGIMMSSIWGLGYNIIEKRSKKLLRRMIATPMKKSHFLISFITVRTIMSFIEALLLFVFAYFFFGITITGNITALFAIFISANIGFAGVAIFTASRTSNTEIGNGLINAVTTPMIVLSGVFFSYHNFPDWAIPFIKILPLTLLADAMRSIFVEGAGFYEITLPLIILFLTGILFFFLGLKIFKWH
jgi:ABC-type multidrug transport system permease subunit